MQSLIFLFIHINLQMVFRLYSVLPSLCVASFPRSSVIFVVKAAGAEDQAEDEVDGHDDHDGEGHPAYSLGVDEDLVPRLGEAALDKGAVGPCVTGHTFLLQRIRIKWGQFM